MKKMMFIGMMVAMCSVQTVMATTNGIEAGACVVFPMGGDIESGEIGLGLQAVVPLSDRFDVEVGVSKFGDSLDITEMSVTQFAVSPRWNHSISDRARFYVGGGLNYNQMEADITTGDIKVQMENVVGYHGIVGLKTRVKSRGILFIDYRMTWLETTAVVGGYGESEVVEGTYDHGLLRVGLNYTF